VVRIHRRDLGRDASAAYARDLLARVRLPDPAAAARAYPHQLSGGQRQRVLLAIALANTPDLLVCDEPTSALDVTVQAQILDLLRPPTLGPTTSLLFISHDLAVVAAVCERVLVMSGGTIVDGGPVTEILRRPRHPYTRALLDAASGVTRTGAARAARAPLPSGAARPDPSSGPDPDPGSAGQPGRVASGDAGLLVEAVGLCRRYTRGRRSLLGGPVVVHALRDVNLRIRRGERLGVVGESGSGKSTLVRILAGLDRPTGGTVRYGGVDLGRAPERQRRRLRADLGVVFQDPTSSLDPRMRVGQIVAEPLVARHGPAGERRRDRVVEVLASVGLPADAADRFPHEFSGGERQRISIARALVARPTVLIADEPVSALDASVRAQILDLLHELAETYDLTLVLVSHDLAVVRQLCDTVAVLHEGRLVESGPTEQVYTAPTHPYTRDLLAAVPRLPDTREGP
jgi:peptide/nickel transport system ATP-binding protein